MVTIRIECTIPKMQQIIHDALQEGALVDDVRMVNDSSGRDDVGYYVEIQIGEYKHDK